MTFDRLNHEAQGRGIIVDPFNRANVIGPDGTQWYRPTSLTPRPLLWRLDTSLQKCFLITEKAGVRFRTEAFNLFDSAGYGVPASVVAGSSFGAITTSVQR